MKIKFIPLLLLGSIFVEAQITSTNGASVYVSPNTLVYSTGDVKVSNTSGVFTNEGNIEISKGTITSSSADKFVLTYTDASNYGQLIIKSATAAGSKADTGDTKEITMQKNLLQRITNVANAETLQINFGVPFVNYTFSQLTKDLAGDKNAKLPSLPCAPPWTEGARSWCYNKPQFWNSHPIFVWNYDNRLRWDPYNKTDDNDSMYINLGKRYIIRNQVFNVSGISNFKGIPYVAGQKENVPASVPFQVVKNYNFGNGIRESAYGVRYYTYLEDPFASKELVSGLTAATSNEELEKVGFANNILYATNPYTSNLNLATLTNNFNGMIGAAVSRGVTIYSKANSREAAKFLLITISDLGQMVGDIDQVSIIPPMSTFIIKTKPENNKTDVGLFAETASLAQTFDYPKEYIETTIPASKSGNSAKIRSYSNSQAEDLYQLNLIMSVDDKVTNTFLATADEFITGEFNDVEASLPYDGSLFTSVYTIPESKEGGINPGFANSKLYINTMNVASSKVAIPVGVNVSGEDKGKKFTFTSELRLNQVPLSANETNYPNPDAKFYFHDKATNTVKEIDQNFTYSVNLEDSTNDRFEIFWSDSGLISNEEDTNDDNIINDIVVGDNNNSLNNSNTINSTSVYKSGSNYKVRFNSNWKKADITIFNVVGQLISSEKNVNTQGDYLLPIFANYSSVYVIVIVNPTTGEKIIKKIVK